MSGSSQGLQLLHGVVPRVLLQHSARNLFQILGEVLQWGFLLLQGLPWRVVGRGWGWLSLRHFVLIQGPAFLHNFPTLLKREQVGMYIRLVEKRAILASLA